jgi:hypothetical protein
MGVSGLFRPGQENRLKIKHGVMVLAVCVVLGGCAGLGSRTERVDGYPDDVYYGGGGWSDPLDPYGPYPHPYGRYGYYGPYGPYGGLGYSGWWWPPVYPVYRIYPQAESAPVAGAKPRQGRLLRLQKRMLDMPEFRLPPVRIAPPAAGGSGGGLRRAPPPAFPPPTPRRGPQPVRPPSPVLPAPARPAPIAPPPVMVPPVRAPRPQAEPTNEGPRPRRIFRRPAPDKS